MMHALFLVLNDTHMLDEIHEIFFDLGVGATTIDSMGMGKVLLEHDVNRALFSNMRMILEGNKPYNKTIISVIREEEKLNKVVEKLKDKLGDMNNKPGLGFIFVIPVLMCDGFKLEDAQG
ncbi:P-II family nitrogen regulator [Clostridiaceae bacterium M8S5]|nr:P-II family nitrogen regulator [Clostridiaceae bacterium M8S5]